MLKSGLLFERIANSMGVFQQTRRRLEDVFRLRLQETSSRCFQGVLIKMNIFVLVTRLQHFFKTFSRRLQNIFKVFCKNVFKTSSRRLQDVFKTSSRCLAKISFQGVLSYSYVFRRRLQDVLIKTNIFALVIRLQDIFKTSSRHLQNVLKASCKNDFKTSSRRLQEVLKTSSKRFQDIFKTSSKYVFKTFSKCIIKLKYSC